MTNTQKTYTPEMMRTELLPSYAGDIQQKIADVSDMLFGIQQNRTLDKGMSMLGLAAKQLKIHGLSRYRSEIGSISYARITDQADAADKEAQKMSEGFQTIFTELYKENILLDTLRAMLDENIKELGFASAALTKHVRTVSKSAENKAYIRLAENKLQDMALSGHIALRSKELIADISVMNSSLSESINSLKVNTLVLWRQAISALKTAPEDPEGETLKRICGIEDVISAAITTILK